MKGPLTLLALLGLVAMTVPTSQILLPALGETTESTNPAVSGYGSPMVVLDDVPPARPRPAATQRPEVFDPSLRVGSKGPEVLALEERLSSLKYLVGKVDGVFDKATHHGVMAFQKAEGLGRNGKGDDATLGRLPTASTPTPAYSGPSNHVELDIPRQIVLVIKGGQVTAVLSTSTGNNKNFTSQGWTRRAITPNGQFKVGRKINGMRVSPLGELYKPLYFNGGIAFHGSPSVPAHAASHGCARLPMMFADWFFSEIPTGTVVYVYGGPTGANPQPYIDDQPASSPSPSPSPSPEPSPSPSPSPTPTGVPVTNTVTPEP